MTALVEKAPKQTKDKLLRGAELARRTRRSMMRKRSIAPLWNG